MKKACCNELTRFLEGELKQISVVVMPDFFLDRLAMLSCRVDDFCGKIKDVTRRKGGSLDHFLQTEMRGGNATNTASALAALGAKVTPIVCTDKFGLKLLRHYLKPYKADLSHVKVVDKPSLTISLELDTKNGKTNIMLRDVGSLADFSFEHLQERDFELLKNADYVCLFNWAGTRNFGTQLASSIFRTVKKAGNGKTYFDTADPTPNMLKIPELVDKVLGSEYVDILSLNENEAVCYAKRFGYLEKDESMISKESAKKAAEILTTHVRARIDLHTTCFSATFRNEERACVPVFGIPVLRATGAGDAWNAGNIIGDANELSDEHRLALANAVAAYYVSSPHGNHPTGKKLAAFCRQLAAETGRKSSPIY